MMETKETDSKYYIPTIDEFHVGFECEINYLVKPWLGIREWVKYLFDGRSDSFDWIRLQLESESSNIRVKCLDRRDILELGWRDAPSEIPNLAWVINDLEWLLQRDSNNTFTIRTYKASGMNKSFDIRCSMISIKNKSELKKLMKQLNIKWKLM